jgi:hypothetical protein
MNEPQFGSRIRQLLNEGARLDAATAERLRAARERALERRQAERASPVAAWADNVVGRFGGPTGVSIHLVIPILLLVVGLAVLHTWHQKRTVAELAELDTQLLADDLPIDAYLDEGFEAWLKRKPKPRPS